jgi:hypothetical protein
MQFGKIHGIALAILGIVQTVYYVMPTHSNSNGRPMFNSEQNAAYPDPYNLGSVR